VFAPSKCFQPSLMLESKAGTYPSGETFSCSTLVKAPSLTPKHWNRLEISDRPNTLAYYENSSITNIKRFITLDSCVSVNILLFVTDGVAK
jgi:hypothetical protein